MKVVFGEKRLSSEASYTDLYVVAAMTVALLLLRDSLGVGVNKYLLLLILGVAAMVFPIRKVKCLIAFAMPLYYGLPGNYLTMIFLLRFLLELRNVKLNGLNLLFCILAGGYILIQSIFKDRTAIAELMFWPGMILIMLMFADSLGSEKKHFILGYAIGTAALGMIMLISTLRIHGFQDLLSAASRLGDDTTRFAEEGIMNVSVDPNFYGMNAISAIAVGMREWINPNTTLTQKEKRVLMACSAACGAVGLIGLSRAFFLVVVCWGILFVFLSNKAKIFASSLAMAALAVAVVLIFMPEVLDAIFERFAGSDMATGNGRTLQIQRYVRMWSATPDAFLLGLGLFNCSVHCAPLQALFGGGFLFVLNLAGYILTLGSGSRRRTGEKFQLQRWLPLVATFMMSLTVPAFGLINSVFPLVFAGLVMRE